MLSIPTWYAEVGVTVKLILKIKLEQTAFSQKNSNLAQIVSIQAKIIEIQILRLIVMLF